MSIIDGKTKRFSANSIFPTFFYATFGLVLDYDRFLATGAGPRSGAPYAPIRGPAIEAATPTV